MKQFFKYVLATMVGMIVLTVVGFILLIGIFGAMASSADTPVKVKENAVYQLDLKGALVDRQEENPLAQLMGTLYGQNTETIGLDDILANIKKAKNDEKIKGIFIKAGSFSGGYASVKEIRDALVDFKESGKFIVAYGDTYSQKLYYLVSVADKILVNPSGMVEWQGMAGEIPFFKGTLDKLGVEMQVLRVGTFKSAVEPYIEKKMSDANRLQVTQYLNSIWNTIVGEVGTSRNISAENLTTYADNVVTLMPIEDVLNIKLIDSVLYADQVNGVINSLLGKADSVEVNYITHRKMNNVASDAKYHKEKIAIIYAVGEIYDGENDGNGEGVFADDLIAEINKVAKDKNVKSVVFRVSSPGGSAYASEQIWHAVSELKKNKPVVVSMGDYAASGGYYISSPANYIIAQPNTLTGSIGIFGLIPNIQGLTEKIGVSFDGVKTNKMSDLISINRPFTPEERGLMQAYINRGYELFVKRCADGRQTTTDSIKKIAEGRVWTGEDALKIGLVDELGGLPLAISKAAELADLKEYAVKEYPQKDSFEEKLIKMLSGDVETKMLKSYLGNNYNVFKTITDVEKLNFIQARMEYNPQIR